jgi:hypothetical protein
MPEPGHLGALGIGESGEAAYELLLAHPCSPVERLTSFWAREEDLEGALTELVVRGLAETLPGDPPGYLALPPGEALGGHLTGLEREFTAARDRVAELTVTYHRHRAASGLAPGTVVEAVAGRAAVLRRIEQITGAAREQIRSLDHSPRVGPNVTHRAIYAVNTDIAGLAPTGQQIRILPSVPMRLQLVDDELALLAEEDMLIVVHPSALLGALSQLFESLWSRALPLPTAQTGQPGADQRLISLLLAGLTDTASAQHLGVSQRTVQRRVAALLDELGVQTRFQAGAKLAFRDARL